jgi:hypothetical protein
MLTTAFGIGALVTCGQRAEAGPYQQADLVSDIAGLAELTDPALKNP